MAALDGVTVVDASSFLTGPFAAMMLGDLGADVIKVEPPGGDPYRRLGQQRRGHGIPFLNANRNKRGVVLDLKQQADRDRLDELLGTADVLITNWRTSKQAGLGLDDRLAERHPLLVWVRITGFGPDGPLADAPAYDTVIQARVGLAAAQGGDGSPLLSASWTCDKVTGLVAAQAALAALHERSRTGRGQLIDLAMIDVLSYFMHPDVAVERTVLEAEPPSPHNRHLAALRPIRTRDGWIVVNPATGRQTAGALEALRLTEHWVALRAIADPADRVAAFCDTLEGATSGLPTAECLELLALRDIAASAVVDLDGHLADAQVVRNGTYCVLEHPELGPIRWVRHPARCLARSDERFAPSLG